MAFWSVLYSVNMLIYALQFLFKERQKQLILLLWVFAIWFIGGFRYNIGVDYMSYDLLYKTVDYYTFDSLLENPSAESSFYYIAKLCNLMSLNSQAFFLLYDTFTIWFIYLGIKRYTTSTYTAITTFILYIALATNGGVWWGFTVVRQAVSVAIVFWGASFLNTSKTKYIICVIIATLIHNSAIVALILLLLSKKRIPFKLSILACALGFIFNFLGITTNIIMSLLSFFIDNGVINAYAESILQASVGTVRISITAIMFFIIYIAMCRIVNISNINPIIYNGASLYIIIRIFTSIGIESQDGAFGAIIHRFEIYYILFFILLLSMAMLKFIVTSRYKSFAFIMTCLFIAAFSIYGLLSIQNQGALKGGVTTTNINYSMRLNLFN